MITQENLKKILHYDLETGEFTYIPKKRNRRKDMHAGCKHHTGYMYIKIEKKSYQVHRLAFLYVNGSFPKSIVDHINGQKDDNRWANLREASFQQNAFNSKIRKSNTTGYKGVFFRKQRGRYFSKAKINGKYFYLGTFDTAIEASTAYENFIKIKHGEFYKPSAWQKSA